MRKFLLHFVFWIVFFVMWTRFVYFYIDNVLNRMYFSALDVSLVILAFYIIYFYIMPDYLRSKRTVRLICMSTLLILILVSFYSWVMGLLLHRMVVPIHFNFSWNYSDLQYNRFFIALLGVLGGCFVKLALDRVEVGRKMQVMEKEKTLAELTYLKAQVNPHFLFNSLNSLYTQLELNSGNAKGTLSALADMLRYQLYECNQDVIAISREMDYLKNYFNLQRTRKDNCKMDLLIGDVPGELNVAPLLLIPFVENAFKYVSDYDDEDNFISVTVRVEEGQLQFVCRNSAENVINKSSAAARNGIGLINVRKRLDLIYGDNYNLVTGFENIVFTVKLVIDLKDA